MPLSHEHVESKIVAKIKNYILARAELLLNLCYEIPCSIISGLSRFFFKSDVRVKISAPTKVVDIPVTLLGYGAYELQCFGENCLS